MPRYRLIQPRIKGIKRIPMALAAHPDTEHELSKDQRRWNCSRSFLLSTIATFHYEQMRRLKSDAAREAVGERITGKKKNGGT